MNLAMTAMETKLHALLFGEQGLPTRPSLSARFLVRLFCIGSFAGAHETVASAFVGHDVVRLARSLHLRDGIRDHGSDARVVTRIEAVDRSLDA